MWQTIGYMYGTMFASAIALSVISRRINLSYLAFAFFIIIADMILTIYPPDMFGQPFPWLHWNWTGKIASILFSIVLVVGVPFLQKESGFTLKQNKGSLGISFACLIFLAVLSVYLDHGVARTSFSAETLAFQSLMPSAAEEVIFRGTLLCVLIRALPGFIGPEKWGLNAGVVAQCLFFAIGHGVGADGWHFVVNWSSLLWTGLIGVVLTLMRLRSGSILLPFVGHTVCNVIAEGLPMFFSV